MTRTSFSIAWRRTSHQGPSIPYLTSHLTVRQSIAISSLNRSWAGTAHGNTRVANESGVGGSFCRRSAIGWRQSAVGCWSPHDSRLTTGDTPCRLLPTPDSRPRNLNERPLVYSAKYSESALRQPGDHRGQLMRKILTKLFGDPNEAPLKPFLKVVPQVNALEPQMEALSDLELRELANELRDRLEEGETLDDLLPESFAATREAGRRTLGQRHFDVQLLGGAVLHSGKIAEMRTGEGKTLTATLAVALNALNSRGVHVVTVNDYLAKRDTQWMGQVYDALGLSVGCIQHDAAFIYDPDWVSEDERLAHLRPISRREAYEADITYGTNNEFGFDYLRDNMVPTADRMV